MHKPVLLKEVLDIFDPKPGQAYIDATINGGGHAWAILERIGRKGKLLGIDWDCTLIGALEEKIGNGNKDNVTLVCDNYANMAAVAIACNFPNANGILLDLGFSSYHVDQSRRGFSFQKDEPLDMRYNLGGNEVTAEHIVSKWPEQRLEEIIREYGEDRYSKRIARAIVTARKNKKIKTTAELSKVIIAAVPAPVRQGRIHPATRTFQALRIAVNDELMNVQSVLGDACGLLKNNGVLTVISFHSLEDRIIKQFFNAKKKESGYEILTKKPIIATRAEAGGNPRARSAKLRALKKII